MSFRATVISFLVGTSAGWTQSPPDAGPSEPPLVQVEPQFRNLDQGNRITDPSSSNIELDDTVLQRTYLVSRQVQSRRVQGLNAQLAAAPSVIDTVIRDMQTGGAERGCIALDDGAWVTATLSDERTHLTPGGGPVHGIVPNIRHGFDRPEVPHFVGRTPDGGDLNTGPRTGGLCTGIGPSSGNGSSAVHGDPNNGRGGGGGSSSATDPDVLRVCTDDTSDPAAYCALFTVALADISEQEQVCTGVVLNDDKILTAAHCVCGRLDGSSLAESIRATIMVEGKPVWLPLSRDPVAVFPDADPLGKGCDPSEGAPGVAKNGDLALITLAPGALDRVQEALSGLVGPTDPRIVRLRAPLGQAPDAIWDEMDGVADTFAIWSYGVGPDPLGSRDENRAVSLPVLKRDECPDGDCSGPLHVTLGDPAIGLCEGDSGAGVFKPLVEGVEAEGYGAWGLMGIVSGIGTDSACHDIGGLLDHHHERRVVRLDTPDVITWLEANGGADLRYAKTRARHEDLTVAIVTPSDD
ncbi:MAG: trypsin-like serine protease [Pseudomonadota bacterium]